MAARFKMVDKPKKLYRYRSFTDKHGDTSGKVFKQEIKAIKENYIWASNFRSMNDPMEGLYRGDESFREKVDLYYDLLAKKSSVGIVSFSETATNELMWAHYTDNMRGICIEYDVPKLLSALDNSDELIKMTYDEEMPTISAKSPFGVLARSILGRKNHRWSQEREWRLMTNRMREIRYNDSSCISQIILGTNVDECQVDRLEELTEFEIRHIHVDGYRLSVRNPNDPLPFAVA